ncbi:general secretion pathway protein GspB [Marinimicrobium agarilyticum]|uniref:general secretion pathway protein GspB n=1 Tax=Marinimicrobium agarilyticum TaxID=306546 RepID=UPI00040AB26F|nr:general secretion pathway protein GspB [Marinimicrobium agarilyticum]
MSMILDALQRADRERQKQDQPLPSLDTPTTPPPTNVSGPRLAWWLAGAGTALALIITLFVALNRPPSTPAPTPQSESPSRTAQAPVAASGPTSVQAAETQTPTGKPPAIAELYQSPQVEDESITALYRTANNSVEATPETSARAIAGADGHTRTLPERPEPTAVRLSEAEPAPEGLLPPPQIASVRDLPWNLQQTMPSINYQQHDYRNNAASRVMINGKEYRAGEQVAPDLTLESIEKDGAVMRYRGYEFKLRALNSWVNM